MKRVSALAAIAITIAGCKPDLAEPDNTVRSARILAVRAEPAEARPGEPVTFTALYVDAKGTRTEAPIEWNFCVDRKPLAELGPVSRACLGGASDALISLGRGLGPTAPLPRDGCRLFGPERPVPLPGEPAGRPVDPDPSGGYFQPLRVESEGALTFFDERISCGLAGVGQETLVDFQKRYQANQNPVVAAFEIAGAPATVAAGASVTLRVTWPGSAEKYAYFEPSTRAVIDRREAIRVAWFSNAGAFVDDRTGRTEGEADIPESTNVWTAPTEGSATLWVVVRDDRGGVAWRELSVRVGD